MHQVLRSPAQALDEETRNWAESAFHSDFGQVRIHTGEQAAASASSIHARAYTVGSQIVLGAGVPSTGPEYRRLMAHELAHVVQQGRAPQRPDSGAREGPSTSGPQLVQRTSTMLQRDDDDAAPEDLGYLGEGLVTALSAPALLLGQTAYGLVHSHLARVRRGNQERSCHGGL